jgi:hypothetical protein
MCTTVRHYDRAVRLRVEVRYADTERMSRSLTRQLFKAARFSATVSAVSLALSMMALLAAAPTSASVSRGVSKAHYIQTADRICYADRNAVLPLKNQIAELESASPEKLFAPGVAELLARGVKIDRTALGKLRHLARPRGSQALIVRWLNATIKHYNDSISFAEAYANEEAIGDGIYSADLEFDKVAENEAAEAYGFMFCGAV